MERQIPNKLFFKIGEVCEITDTQPYVLRYWESEFPALAPAKNTVLTVYRPRNHCLAVSVRMSPARAGSE